MLFRSVSQSRYKALVKIADTKKHREHFTALQEELNCDKSGINESRVCYESYDPDIYINTKAEPYKKFKKVEKITEVIQSDEDKTIRNILTWLGNKGELIVTGKGICLFSSLRVLVQGLE